MIIRIWTLCLFALFANPVWGQTVSSNEIYQGGTEEAIQLDQVIAQIHAGDIIVVGEAHDRKKDHDHQLELIQALAMKGYVVNVGMEFFSYPDQAIVDEYLDGTLAEADFLSSISWGGDNFDLYRGQLWAASASGGHVVALNMPRIVTKEISKNGIENLPPDYQKLMPPNFEVGNEFYKQRFFDLLGGHGSHQFLENMFVAQSTWDETMAWTSIEFMKARPGEVMVIIVGNFHVAYDGGLPDRIRARGYGSVKTITHLDEDDLTMNPGVLLPDPTYGILSDWVWMSSY